VLAVTMSPEMKEKAESMKVVVDESQTQGFGLDNWGSDPHPYDLAEE
jgi:hypothetical protein